MTACLKYTDTCVHKAFKQTELTGTLLQVDLVMLQISKVQKIVFWLSYFFPMFMLQSRQKQQIDRMLVIKFPSSYCSGDPTRHSPQNNALTCYFSMVFVSGRMCWRTERLLMLHDCLKKMNETITAQTDGWLTLMVGKLLRKKSEGLHKSALR